LLVLEDVAIVALGVRPVVFEVLVADAAGGVGEDRTALRNRDGRVERGTVHRVIVRIHRAECMSYSRSGKKLMNALHRGEKLDRAPEKGLSWSHGRTGARDR